MKAIGILGGPLWCRQSCTGPDSLRPCIGTFLWSLTNRLTSEMTLTKEPDYLAFFKKVKAKRNEISFLKALVTYCKILIRKQYSLEVRNFLA